MHPHNMSSSVLALSALILWSLPSLSRVAFDRGACPGVRNTDVVQIYGRVLMLAASAAIRPREGSVSRSRIEYSVTTQPSYG